MPMIAFEHVSFAYPGAVSPVLRDIDWTLVEGELAVVAGPSGAGKSTLLRCINGLVPHFSGGTFGGRVVVDGLNPLTARPEAMCWHVGFVFQDPEAQFVMDRVEDEVAFALENAAIPRHEMRARIEEVLALLSLERLRDRDLATLSGGEKQRVAIAAALALRPRVLVLDEPTSQLDPQSAQDVLDTLAQLNRDAGLTIVLAEHRLERVLPFAHQLVHISGQTTQGSTSLVAGPPREVLSQIELAPPVVVLGRALQWSPLPITVAEARRFGPSSTKRAAPAAVRETGQETHGLLCSDSAREGAMAAEETTVRAEGLQVAYNGRRVLDDVALDLHRGEVTVMVGRNGAGKSTLLKALVGLVPLQRGQVWVGGREASHMTVAEICRQVAYLAQDPNALLFADTVMEELLITLRNHRILATDAPINPDALLDALGLRGKADAYPRDLSVGERQRVALAAITVTAPSTIMLDEPTRGLDYDAKAHLLELIHGWRNAGHAVLLVTHDVELAAAAADRIVVLDGGTIVAEGRPAEVMPMWPEFAPQIARLFPGTGWLTAEDALAGLQP